MIAVFIVRRKSSVAKKVPQKKPNRFAAVELMPALESCEAAQQLAGKRILANDAPVLPLEGCTERCRCAYKRLADRRQGQGRASDYGLPGPIMFTGQDKRKKRDRRKAEM